jgi:5-methylcytosine-specific restriction endonuclease McrA
MERIIKFRRRKFDSILSAISETKSTKYTKDNMEYFKRHLNDYEDATQKEPKAKRALILALYDVLSIAETIEKDVKDKATFEALFDKSVSTKTKFTKSLGELATHLNDANKQLNVLRNDRRAREKEGKKPKPTVGGATTAATPSNVIVPDEDPVSTIAEKPPTKVTKTGTKLKKMKITLAMREQIWKKYVGRTTDCACPVCQTRVISMIDFSAGHITAEVLGGATDITNLVPICGNCNSRMSTENLFEYTMKNYMRAPVFPGLEGEKRK